MPMPSEIRYAGTKNLQKKKSCFKKDIENVNNIQKNLKQKPQEWLDLIPNSHNFEEFKNNDNALQNYKIAKAWDRDFDNMAHSNKDSYPSIKESVSEDFEHGLQENMHPNQRRLNPRPDHDPTADLEDLGSVQESSQDMSPNKKGDDANLSKSFLDKSDISLIKDHFSSYSPIFYPRNDQKDVNSEPNSIYTQKEENRTNEESGQTLIQRKRMKGVLKAAGQS